MTFIFIKLIINLIKNLENISIGKKKDWTLFVFWLSIYAYCISGLIKLEIIKNRPMYGIFAVFLFLLTLFLVLIEMGERKDPI